MANYAKMARDAADRRKTLESELAKARKTVKECEKELAVLSQIIGALKGVGPMPGRRGPKAKRGSARRRGGKWKPGRPGRPPKWYVEQQKAAGGKGKRKAGKRRARRVARRAAAKPAPAPAPAATPPSIA